MIKLDRKKPLRTWEPEECHGRENTGYKRIGHEPCAGNIPLFFKSFIWYSPENGAVL
jgi:hypothetical protein